MDYRFTILLVLASGTYAGPVARRATSEDGPATCATTCTSKSKFSYTPGTTYDFKYEVETKTSMLGASEDKSIIGITAMASIEVHSKCEMILTVRDVTIYSHDTRKYQDQDKKKEFSLALQRRPLRFSFQDGVVDGVCPDTDEVAWVLNVKKGILSTFQNSMINFVKDHSTVESDVSGKCETQYKVTSEGWRSVALKKTKSLEDCSHRHDFDSAIQTIPFRVSSGLKSLPILRSSHECDVEVNKAKGILTSTVCHEMLVLRPFSKETSGATTETTQKLDFVQEKKTVANADASAGQSQALHFEHPEEEEMTDLSAREALNMLKDVCQSFDGDVTPETPAQFNALVATMKRVDYTGLRRVYNQVHKSYFCKTNGETVRKFALDAIPMVGTDASVELMKTLLSNEDVKGDIPDMWLGSLAFIQRPTVKMIMEIAQLTGLPSMSTKVLLPLSALVNAYCGINTECENIREVKNVIEEIERNIQGGCKVDQSNFRMTMMSLRAIGNMGHAETSVPSLYNCMTDSSNPMDIRVAAIDAFRRLSCGADRNNMMAIFRDTQEDSELRISAYLGVMRCPTSYVISQVKETLAIEEVNQVGSFVWSHMTNLMESSDPANKLVQQLLNDDPLDKEFDLDKLKFSRNYEGSFFMEGLNAGAKLDSNLVWSTKSFVPRAGYFNLTTNVFGETLNLFEIGGRVEGLDRLLESYYGPQGYFNTETKDTSNDVPEADPRFARLSGSKLNSIRSKNKVAANDLRGAMYMRMFGNEMSYSMFGANNGINTETRSDSDMLTFLNKWRNNERHDISLTRSFLFLDSTFTVPTIAGLPLKLTVNGTATVALTAGGQIDLKKPATNVLLEGNLEPSATVEVDSTMSVDAFVTRGGLRMTSNLHTTTGAKAKVQVTDGSVVDLTFDMTKEKQEIVNFKNSFFILYNDVKKEQNMIVKNRMEKKMCTGSKIQKILGVEWCTSMSLPNATFKEDAPHFPFSGPVEASVSMIKKDIPNGYKFEAKVIKTPVQTLFRMLTDTPGSTANRAIGLDVVVMHKAKTVDVDFVSPWKKATLTGELIDQKDVKGLMGKINVDDGARLYNLDAKIKIDEAGDQVTYTPSISLEVPDWKNVQMTGELKYLKKLSLDTDLTITGATETPITLQAAVMNTKTQVGTQIKFNYGTGAGYALDAYVGKKEAAKKLKSVYTFTPRLFLSTPEDTLIEAGGSLEYNPDKSVKLEGRVQKVLNNDIVLKGEVSKTDIPKKKRVRYNTQMKVECGGKSSKFTFMLENRQDKNVFSRVRFDYNFGKQYRDTLILQSRVKMNLGKTKSVVKLTSNLNSLRNNNLDSSLSVNFGSAKFLTSFSAAFKYGKNLKSKASKDRINLNFQAKHKLGGAKKTVNYTLDFNFPAKNIEVKINGGHVQEGRIIAEDISLQYHPKRTVSLNLHFHNKTAKYPNYAGQIGIGLPEGRAMSFAGAFGRESEDKYVSSVEFEIIKGRRTRIDSMLKMASESLYEVKVGVQLPDLEPVRVFGGYNKLEKGYKASAWFKRGEKLYSITGEGALDLPKAGAFKLDVIVPSRRVIIMLEGSLKNTERNTMLDIQWNADKNLDDRFLFNMSSDVKGSDDFETAMMLHYPGRTIEFSMKHSSGARYITNVQLSWSPEDKVELDLIFRNDKIDGQKRTELSVMFTSPFEPYEALGVAVSLFRDDSQYQTKSSLTWAKNKKILVSAKAKVPFSVKGVDIVGRITTPFKGVKSIAAQVNHKLDDTLSTSVLFEWGANRLALTADGSTKVTALGFESFDGNLDIRTPWEGMRIFLISSQFTNNKQNKITSRLTLDMSRYTEQKTVDKYVIEMDMLYNRLPDSLTNDGNLRITIPNDDISTNWKVTLKRNLQHVLLSINPQRGNNFKVMMKNSWDINKIVYKYGSSFQLVVPAESFKEMSMDFGFEARDGYVEANTLMQKDTIPVFSHSFKYQLGRGSLQLTSKIDYVTVDEVSFKLVTSHSLMPYRANLELQWAPYQKITADSNLIYNEFGMYDMSLKVKTPFPRYQTFVVSTTRKRMGLNWEASSEIEFAPQQKIQLETVYRYDHVKVGSVSLKTPFPQFPGLDTAVHVEGSPFNFKGDASFNMMPYVGKIASDFSWSYYKGTSLSGIFNLNTPFRQYPYMKAKVSSNLLGTSRLSKVEVEYLPTQIVKVEADYRFTSFETLEGNLKVTSPYTDNKQVVAGFKHIGNSEEFTTDAKLTCKCFKRPAFTKATFSSKTGIISTFEMDSPFRGYETVKWNLNHQGSIKDFHTIVEYETSGKKIALENVFNIKNKIQAQSTLLTPFPEMSKAHVKFMHDGEFFNTETVLEGAFNEEEVKAEVDLTDKSKASTGRVLISTPFKNIEKLELNVARKGSLNDFEVTGDLDYDQSWHGTVKHKAEVGDIHSSLEVQTPIGTGNDISAKFDFTGDLTNFETSSEVILGLDYRSKVTTKFVQQLQNITASVDLTSQLKGKTYTSIFSLDHGMVVEKQYYISTKLHAETGPAKLNAGFDLSTPTPGNKNMNLKTFVDLELPVKDFESSQIFYEYRTEQLADGMTEFGKLVVDVPALEKIEQVAEAHTTFTTKPSYLGYGRRRTGDSGYGAMEYTYASKRTLRYGEVEIIEEVKFVPGKLTYKFTTPYEGYETTTLEIDYKSNLGKVFANQILEINGKLTSSSLPSDVTAAVEYKNDLLGASKTIGLGLNAAYSPDEIIAYSAEWKAGVYYIFNVTTPYKDFEYIDTRLFYDEQWKNADLTIKSSLLDAPITATTNINYNHIWDMELSGKLTSGFPRFTNVKTELRTLATESAYEPYLLMSWEDEGRQLREIEATGEVHFMFMEFKQATAGFKFGLKTPFESVEAVKVWYDHQHYGSPMRAKEVAYVQFNKKTYLDMEAEIGALNKFTGSVIFKEPRQMEFSFSGLNEGESIDVDLHINWNKQDRQSMFRLQFGLADDSNKITQKKVFHFKVTNPTRIIAIKHNLEMKETARIHSDGMISWDLENDKEATYDFTITKEDMDRNAKLEIVVPSRTIKVSGSSVSKGKDLLAAASVLWDAQGDADKMVEVAVTLTPGEMDRAIVMEVNMPSMKKKLVLKSDLSVAPTFLQVSGNTQLSYAPEEDKTVYITYSISGDDVSGTSRSVVAKWSLRHSATGTDMEGTGQTTLSAMQIHAHSILKYKPTSGRPAQHEMTLDVDKQNRLATVEIKTAKDTVLMTGQLTVESPYILTAGLKHNSQPKWSTVWKVDTVERSLEASMTYDDQQKKISTRAFFPNDTSFESETTSESERGSQQEGYATANLNDRVLHGHLKWRPDIVKDVMVFGSDCLVQLGTELNQVMQDNSNGFGSEVFDKYRRISGSIVQEMAPLSDSFNDEVRLIQRDLRDMRRTLKKMHKNNEMYLGTLEQLGSGTMDTVIAGYSEAVKKVGQGYRQMQETVEELSNKIDQYPLQEKYTAMKATVNNFVQESSVVIEEQIKVMLEQIGEFVEMTDKTMKEALTELQQYTLALIDELALTPFLEELKVQLDQLKVKDIKDIKLHKLLNQIHQLLIDTMEQTTIAEKYRLIAKRASQISKEEFGDLLQNKDVKDLYDLVQNIYKQVTWLYQYTEEMDFTSLSVLMNRALAVTREKLMAEFNQLPIGILDMHKSTFTTFDLENGEVEFDLYLPIPMENFEELLRFSVKKYMAKLEKMADKYFPRGTDICLWDFYYRIPAVQWSMREDWVPPFNAFATVSGTQHYRTFDGRHFDLAGMCSYILVEDLVDGNFSVVQRYDGGPKTLARESLTVMVHGHTIEIMKDFMVKVDGQPHELPYMTNGISLVRRFSRIILTTDVGLEIISDFARDYTMIGLSGWYFGKVGGLLGTYDNEQGNDMMVPGGQLEARGQKFLNAWEVDKSCRSKRMYAAQAQKSQDCTELFEKPSSLLRPCFTQVDPADYQTRCDLNPEKACNEAMLYRHTCAKHGITLDIPQTPAMSCVHCSGSSPNVFKTIEPERIKQSMDVVFVVEEQKCNRDVADRLNDIIYQMEQSMLKSGLSNNRYSLVGYSDSQVSSHTMEGKLFNGASKVGKGLENLRFTSQASGASQMEAMRYASTLPFREGVTKIVVLLSCSGCTNTNALQYYKLAMELRHRDITLHVLRENSFKLKNNRIPQTQIYGIDNNQAYVGRAHSGESDLYPQIDTPSDYCAAVAMRSNGSLFDAIHVNRGSLRQQRAFLRSFGGRVAETATGAQCQECSCEQDEHGNAFDVCRPCKSTFLNPTYAKELRKYMMDLNNDVTNFMQAKLF